MAAELLARLTLRDEYSAELKSAKEAFGRFGGGIKSLGDSFFSLKTAMIGALGYLGGKATFGFAVSEAMEAEQATQALASALDQVGLSGARALAPFEALADALAETSKYADKEIKRTEALLLIMGTAPDRIERTTEATLDLASAFGVDLETAARAVGKAIQGNTEGLSRFGMVLSKDAIPPGREFEAVLGAIEARVGGRAGKEIQTFSGAAAQLGKAVSGMMESLGKIVTEGGGGLSVIQELSAAFKGMKDFVEENRDVFREAALGIAQALVQLGKMFAQIIGGVIIPLVEKLGGVTKPLVYQFDAWAAAQEGMNEAAVFQARALLANVDNLDQYHAALAQARQDQTDWSDSMIPARRISAVLKADMLGVLAAFQALSGEQMDFRSGMQGAYLAMGQMTVGADALVRKLGDLSAASAKARADREREAATRRSEVDFSGDVQEIPLPTHEAAAAGDGGPWGGWIDAGVAALRAFSDEAVGAVASGARAVADVARQAGEWAGSIEGQRAIETQARDERIKAEVEERAFVEANLAAILAGRIAVTNRELALAREIAASRKQQNQQTVADYGSMFGALAGLAEAGGRQLFGVQKAFAIAEATMSGYVAIGKATELGFPMSIPVVIMETARMLANLAAIRSTQPGGGGGGGHAAGGGGGISAGGAEPAAATSAFLAPPAAAASRPRQDITITVNGLAVVQDQVQLARIIADLVAQGQGQLVAAPAGA